MTPDIFQKMYRYAPNLDLKQYFLRGFSAKTFHLDFTFFSFIFYMHLYFLVSVTPELTDDLPHPEFGFLNKRKRSGGASHANLQFWKTSTPITTESGAEEVVKYTKLKAWTITYDYLYKKLRSKKPLPPRKI